ncbi:phage BR0599 family protein [uncultured Halopseudomonas sp.]|uniref:phage BR0599 family protein n=1 Tax=uncultured Halopseudomonas sp. TaxID=2901193 RepID=UPI0030EF5908|tara:strand:- start:19295 stop:20116 length:822 start_codon:yes stop_codon:yes gene_type:complete
MSFDQREGSIALGQPIRLYKFSRGVIRWLYNSSDRDITYNNQVFRALVGGISDRGIQQSGDAKADALTITAPSDISVAQPFRTFPPSERIELVIFDMHYGDAEARLAWPGRIASVNWPSLDSCRIECVTRDAEMSEPGLTDVYSRMCTARLGDNRCNVDLNPYRITTTLQAQDGQTVSAPAFAGYPDGWFAAGWLEWSIGSGEYDRRHIEQHIGTDLQLLGGTAGIPAGATVRVYPGCDFLAETCDGKFDNLDNMRAIPHLQGKSPFDGDQVW